MLDKIVYHGGSIISDDKFEDVIWFSSEPIDYFGELHTYRLKLNNPLIVNAQGEGWSHKLWHECCDSDGTPNISPYNARLTAIMPAFCGKWYKTRQMK